MASQQENIFDVSSDVLDVDALKSISVNAKEEESSNLEANINALSNEKEHICLPYPDVGPLTRGVITMKLPIYNTRKGAISHHGIKLRRLTDI